MTIEAALESLRSELASQSSPAKYACDRSGQGRVEWGVALIDGAELIPLKAAYFLLQMKLGSRIQKPREFNTKDARKVFIDMGLRVEKRTTAYWRRVLQASVWEPLPDVPEFKVGRRYKRSHLHEHYGGQEQGGVITPTKVAAIFLVTGASGKQHGYADVWHDDGRLSYFGEGQNGPMRFIKGNRAIRDHKKDGKQIHIFRDEGRGWLSYTGEFDLVDYDDQRQAPDSSGQIRTAIVFELIRCDLLNSFVQDVVDDVPDDADLDDLYLQATQNRAPKSSSGKKKTFSSRVVYDRLRAIVTYVCRRANGACEGCEKLAPFKTARGRPFLEAHHIDHLSDGGLDHPINVAAVCPNCHRRAHHASDRKAFNAQLRATVKNVEKSLGHDDSAKIY